jgi:hypothetical protein
VRLARKGNAQSGSPWRGHVGMRIIVGILGLAAFAGIRCVSMSLPAASDLRLAALNRWVVDDLGFAGAHRAGVRGRELSALFSLTRGRLQLYRHGRAARQGGSRTVRAGRGNARRNRPQRAARVGARRERGLLLLTDLGSRQYLDELSQRAPTRGRRRALRRCARCARDDADRGPRCALAVAGLRRALLIKEMELMPEWFLRPAFGHRARRAPARHARASVRDSGAEPRCRSP